MEGAPHCMDDQRGLSTIVGSGTFDEVRLNLTLGEDSFSFLYCST
jgi:hypothetical protein